MTNYEVISKSKQIRENNGINFILNGDMGQQAVPALNASENKINAIVFTNLFKFGDHLDS